MTHLTQEDLILTYYRELDSGAHLASCEECRAELARLANVLDRVTPVDVPEPAEDYETRVWDRLEWRLRGAAGAQPAERRSGGLSARRSTWLAIAAVLALAFVTAILVRRPEEKTQIAQTTSPATTTIAPVAASTQQQRDRILLVVVGDHFDQSERMLVELTNLTPASGDNDISTERERAEELLASNRLYRRTAADRGEEQVATLLDELEPVLLQLAHAPSQVSAEELRSMQKRVEAKGIVFKLRVVRAGVRNDERAPRTNAPTV